MRARSLRWGNVGFRRCRAQAPGYELGRVGGGYCWWWKGEGGREGRPLDSIAGQAIEDEVLSARRP